MLELTTIPDLKSWSLAQRAAGRRIGLVPTMGFLHEGHLALVDEARRRAEAVVLSIFVNPLQFGPQEDLARYPRDLARDRSLAQGRGVDAIFVPEVSAMYPAASEVRVIPGPTADRWEGAARPGHFSGVLTIVAKLLHLAEPNLAVFGQKDIQQLTLIRRMVQDLDWPVEITMVRTVREPDGLALSSRNSYLSTADRERARVLSRALQAAHRAWRAGEILPSVLDAVMRQMLAGEPTVAVEYIAVVDPDRLAPVEKADGRTIIAIAARVGSTRLIDNIILGEGIRGMSGPVSMPPPRATPPGLRPTLPEWAIVTPARVEHIQRVAELAAGWAEQMGVPDSERNRWLRAVWLHDALRDAPPEELAKWAASTPGSSSLWHGPASSAHAKAEGETDRGVLDAVRYHSVGLAEWDMVGRILYCADYLDPARPFDRDIRGELARRLPQDPGGVLREVARARLLHLVKTGWPILDPTVRFWNSLAAGSGSR